MTEVEAQRAAQAMYELKLLAEEFNQHVPFDRDRHGNGQWVNELWLTALGDLANAANVNVDELYDGLIAPR